MCGIAGIAGKLAGDPSGLVRSMCDSLVHRGPDDAGIWFSPGDGVSFGHRRLAIIDLSAAGHQPMADQSGQLQITFNGEIYNYQELQKELIQAGHCFRTATDTEVILEAYRAWGTGCLSRLNGMFAFVLYDHRSRVLFGARDRAGEKPLFYHHAGGRLAFGSELKAILADPELPRELDPESLQHYLAYGYVPQGRCILKGFRKLPAAHALLYHPEQDQLQIWPYWKLPDPCSQDVEVSEEDLLDQLESLLRDAVERQLIADVPVGILLSGGLDSSLITAMASQRHSGPVRTFTITFPGHGSFDEGPFARIVAKHFSTDHTELIAEDATIELLPQLACQYDEPIADSSMVPTYLVSKLVRQSNKVALGGDGGDELFGGYSHYNWINRLQQAQRLIPKQIRHTIANSLAERLPIGFRGRHYLRGLGVDGSEIVSFANLYFDKVMRERLIAPLLSGIPAGNGSPESSRAVLKWGRTATQQATALDFLTYLPDDILVKVDRASMLNSLEVRAPFLDYRIIEFAFGRVPDRWRATKAGRKILLRKLAQRVLPPELDLTRKQGFSLPLARWFKGSWGAFLETVLNEADPAIFNRNVIQDLLRAQRRGYTNMHRLFALTMFELWRREYSITI
jgi:asparagine synthase (glutamine-hydrolysing)